MRAVVLTALDGPGSVRVHEVPEPVPTDEQVLIDVAYAGVLFPDVLHTRGAYQVRPEPPFVLGWEVSGVVRHDAGGFSAGDRVAALPGLGGFADVAAVDASSVFLVPDGVSLRSAAAVPLNYLTAHLALVRRARLRPTDHVLVHGAAGGLGSATCQLAAALDARVTAVVSTDDKREIARLAGARDTILAETFLEDVRAITGGAGVDVVVDPVGGDRFADSLRSLAPEGRLLVLGFRGGSIPTVKVNRLLLTNTSVMGVALPEFWETTPDYAATQWRDLVPHLRSGALDPPITATFPLEQAGTALHRLENRQVTGRVVLKIGRDD